MVSRALKVALGGILLLSLPLLGAFWAGQSLAPYFEFPPKPWPVAEVPFSWPLFWGYLILELPVYAALGWLLRFKPARPLGTFPPWGWGALGWLAAAWYIAWARPSWLGELREFSFTLLWLGYIGTVNALCQQRIGFCFFTRQSKLFLGLFPLSAAFWWYFEYLNRFVGNWHYLGAEDLTAWQYFWRATLPFSTVLPAVVSTIAWLSSLFAPRALPSFNLPYPRRFASGGIVLANLGLFGIGFWPKGCFPLLWLAPLVLLAGLQVLAGQESYFAPLRQGKWEILLLPMLAGLVCGVFWEMWNYLSSPKWVYTVPFVSRFKIFEMPLLGYAGYLPFGLECALVVDFWSKSISHAAPSHRSC